MQELLGESARPSHAVRCQECPGCKVFKEDGKCGRCQGCLTKKGCAEYQILCFTWDRSANPFHDRSSVTGVSSHFDLAKSDLNKYHALVESLKELSLELEDAVDGFPAHLNRTEHPRYGDEQRKRTLENEEIHLTLVDDLVAAQAELRERLREVDETTDDEKDEPEFESPHDDVTQDLTVTQRLNSLPLPHRWQADTSDYPLSPLILETIPRPETKELEESNEIKTGTGDDAQPRQEPPVQTDSENQLAAPDIGDKATDNVQPHRPRSSLDVVRVQDR